MSRIDPEKMVYLRDDDNEYDDVRDLMSKNIMRKVAEITGKIDTVKIQHIGNSKGDNNSCLDHILVKPDFQVVIGGCVREGDEYMPVCQCFFGGEIMKCIKKHFGSDDKIDGTDTFLRRDGYPKEGEKMPKDIYTDCAVRHLAQIASQAYRQAKAEEQK